MGEGTAARDRGRWVAVALLAYPWLHRGASGPVPAAEPALVTLACLIGLLVLACAEAPLSVPRALVLAAVGAIAFVVLGDALARRSAAPTPAVALAALSIAAIATCAALSSAGDRSRWAERLAWGWGIAALASTVIALAQYAGVEHVLGSLAAPSPAHHAFGNLRQRNHFATLACIGLASTVYLGVHARALAMRLGCAAAALVVSAGLAASGSRTGLLEIAVLLPFWFARRDGDWRRWATGLAAAYAVAALALLTAGGGQGVLNRLAGDAPDCHGRRILWTTVAQLVGERPWTGWGWDALPLAVYESATEPHFCALVENAHDLPLHLAFAFGVPLALLACGVGVFAALRARPWSAATPGASLGFAVLAAILVHSLLEYPLWYGPFQMAFGFALGLAWRSGSTWRVSRAVVASVSAAWLAAGLFVAFDYARVSQPFMPASARWRWLGRDPLAQAQRSWLFADVARYAELALLPVTPDSAARVHALSGEVMRFEPVPGVVDKRIESARLLGLDAEADAESRRLRRAYPPQPR